MQLQISAVLQTGPQMVRSQKASDSHMRSNKVRQNYRYGPVKRCAFLREAIRESLGQPIRGQRSLLAQFHLERAMPDILWSSPGSLFKGPFPRTRPADCSAYDPRQPLTFRSLVPESELATDEDHLQNCVRISALCWGMTRAQRSGGIMHPAPDVEVLLLLQIR